MKNLIILLVILPIFCFGQSVPGCNSYVASAPITATSNSTISGLSIDCGGAATIGINIPAGVHDVHITKCKIMNAKTSRGLILIGSGCYNITIDTCFLQSGWRGINAVGATNNIHIWNNYFYNIIDPNVTATSSDGGGSSVQLNNCNGSSIQVLDNKSYHDVSGAGVGDQFSVYESSGTVASPIRVCRNQALNGSNNPPSTGYAGAVGGDSGGAYQRIDSNTFVNVGAVGAQIQGGHDIEMSYNTVYIGQSAYSSAAMGFGDYSGVTSYNITMANNTGRCTQPTGAVRVFWFDTSTAFQPAGWSTNISSTTLTENILPSPLLPSCAVPTRVPNISFSPSTYTLTKGLAIFAFSPNNSGSAATYTATLPTGLIIDPGTGNISGTPTVLTPSTAYTITAKNTAGTSTTVLTIAVVSDATLKQMTISGGSVSPGFNNLVTNYTATVDNSVTSITLTPTANQASSTIMVNGVKVNSGSASGAINLSVGTNIITTVVTASDGVTTKSYTLTVTRAAISATLSSLVLSNGTLSPAFSSSTTNYTATVANTVTAITITPTVKQANTTVTVNGTAVVSGSASGTINLVAGTNIITTIVTASDGVTTKTYTVTVTRAASADATLSSLALSNGTLAPAFDGGTTNYTASVDNSVTSITLTPTVNQSNATVWVNGIAVPSGNASGAINLVIGTNTITTIVIAQDGVTSNTYTVTVTRSVAMDATLSALAIDNGTLSPAFDGGTTAYTASVDNTITSVTLTPTLNQANATVTVNGNAVSSGSAAVPVNLAVGVNTITTVVTAQDGVTNKTYTLTITRAVATDATLSSLSISNGTLAPVFDSGTMSYAASVDNSIATVNLTPTLNQTGATITVNGSPVNSGGTSDPINLAVGVNIIPTVVTAPDGASTYTITVTRAPSTDATLSLIVLGNGTLSPIFDSNTTSYKDSVDNATSSITLTPTVNQANATVTVNGATVASGGTSNPISLAVGDNVITMIVTAQDGSTNKTYTLTVTRPPAASIITFSALAKATYGDSPITLSASSNNTDDGVKITYASDNTAVATVSNNTITIVGAGTANITASEIASANFKAAPDVIQPLTVNQANLTITAKEQTKLYGSTFAFNGTEFKTEGLVKNDVVSTVTLASSGADLSANSGSYPIIVSAATGNGLGNYNISYQQGTLTVSDVNLTFAPITSQVYGAADFSPGAVSNTTINYSSSNTNVAVIISGNVHIVGAGASVITSTADTLTQTQTLNVAPAPLAITTKNVKKTYGDVLTDDNNSTAFDAAGLQNGETISNISIAYGTGALANAPVTTYSGSVVPSAPTGGNFNAANYNITYTPANIIVGQADLTITADNQSKAAGTDNPPLTVSYKGFVSNDTPASLTSPPVVSTTANTNSLAGGYTITANGAIDSNYNISYVDGTLTVSGLALSFGSIPSKIYGVPDFDPGAASSSAITYTSSDTTVATIVSGNIHIVGVGNSTITANDGVHTLNQTLNITPATLYITAGNQSKTYGLRNPDPIINYSGFAYNDSQATLISMPIASTSATLLSPVGSYPITASGAAAGPNYNILYNDGTLSVTPAPLMISAVNQTKSQGTPNPPLTMSPVGFMNGEGLADLTTQPFISTTATDNSPVNTYPITVSGAVDPNYVISYVQGTLTVTGNALTFNPIPSQPYGAGDFSPGASSSAPTSYTSSNTAVATIVSGNIHIIGGGSTVITANNGSTNLQQTLTVTPVPLSIMANSLSKTYGAVNPALTLGYSGFVNGDGPSTLATPPSVNTTAVTSSGTGNYPITASSAADTRYVISYVPGTMTVNPAALTITANNLSKPQGTANPTLTVSYNSLVNNDTPASLTTQPVITTTAVTSSPIGTYPITASGAASPNYTISYVPGILTVTTATLTFSAIPSQAYGAADFSAGATSTAGAITYTSSNTAVATIVSGNIHIVGAGTSAITANNGSTSLQQTLTVTPVALTITANSINKVYGATLSNGAGSTAFTTSGLVGGQTVGSVTMTYGTGAAATVAIGTYSGAATPSAATGGTFTAGNYTITYNSNSIVVGRATLKITANNVTKSYGTTLTGGTGSTAFTSTGLANGQTIGSITIAYGTGATATTAPGTYNGSITPSAATGGTFTAGNYTISYTTGNITVNKAALTITANNLTKAQGAANPTLTISYSGFVNGQTNTVLTTQPTMTTTATTSSPAGTYPITPSGAAAANYNISYVAGTLTVTGNAFAFGPIPSKVYGIANFSPGATGSGTITYTSSNTAVAIIVSNNIHIVGVGASTITATSGSTKLTQTLTVTRATLTITANTVNKAYGVTLTTGAGSTAFTSTGLANGQTIGSVTMTYGTGAAATAALNTYTGAITPSAATGGTLTAANYNITYVKGNIVVVKAMLKIIANNVTKTYGTSISGGTGSKAFTTTGLANGQTISSVTIAYGTGAATTSNAGNYSGAVTPSAATGGTFVAADYTITYTSGNITVSQAALKITANNQTKIQGKANPTLTVSYSGFVNGQSNTVLTTQPKITTTATTNSAVGKYPITASGAVGANYTITYVAGTLTVSAQTKALVSVNRPILVAVTDSDKFDLAPMEPVVKQAVSPNGDGINDVLTIENIEQYPDNKVMLMNRNGTTIFEMTGYNNMNKVFDGHSNITRAMQQPGTYFYMVEYKVKEEVKHKTGYFIIKY